jgi:arsenite/tail-anchored protein-transporting ATPase
MVAWRALTGMPLDALFEKRVVLITGKGGVGRSLVTAALASAAARRGLRALVADIGDDPKDYSPLARYFGKERMPVTPAEVAPGIRGVVLLARTGQELFLRTALHSATLARAALSSDALRRLLSAGPSFREMGVFFQLLSYLRAEGRDKTPEYPLIVIDMPATGHALSLTGLPDLLLRLMPSGPIASALREGQSYLNDPERAAAWVVTLPETLPVSEALELLEGLGKTKMPVGGVLLNRFPSDPFTPAERAALRPLVDETDLLGAEGFRRPELATREAARLRDGTKSAIYRLPELPHEGLVTAIADEIERARRVRPSVRP